MNQLYWLSALTVVILLLAIFVYKQPRKSDLDLFHEQVMRDIEAEVKDITEKFRADLNQQVLKQLEDAGVSR